jgi:hypothetical protein
MTPSEADFGLLTIKDRLSGILSPNAGRVLDDARAQFSNARELFSKTSKKKHAKLPDWGFAIARQNPLIFRDCEVRDNQVRVDLFCSFRWPGDPSKRANSHTLGVRIWSLDKKVCFRDKWDAAPLKDSLGDPCRRVMLRCHFDLANSGQAGPRYHIQVGGVPDGDEFYWAPPTINLPRIMHPPTDIVLACQLIAANFFPSNYSGIKNEATWKNAVRTSQTAFLGAYFGDCQATLARNEALLDALWNPAA